MDRRSAFIAGAAGVMALILIMVLVYAYRNMMPLSPAEVPLAAAPSPTLLLPPPVIASPSKTLPLATRARPVIAVQKPAPTVITFTELDSTFTGTWAAYPGLCENAYYSVHPQSIRVAGGSVCAVSHIQGNSSATSATVVMECRDGDYAGREVWTISQPRPGALSIRPQGGNAVSLIDCTPQLAAQ